MRCILRHKSNGFYAVTEVHPILVIGDMQKAFVFARKANAERAQSNCKTPLEWEIIPVKVENGVTICS
jgi:hypothetical protein